MVFTMLNESLYDRNSSVIDDNPWANLNVLYTVFEVLVAMAAIVGNSLVIFVYLKDRRLRRRTKYYIISLAIADFLVGVFGIPFAILASVGLPRNKYLCLSNMSLLVVLCTTSIFCLVAVSVDRYWAILYPMSYSRNVRSRTTIGIIIVCWLAAAIVGFLPLFGWNEGGPSDRKCYFVEVMNYNYLVFLYFATIIVPAVLLTAFYAHIYKVVIQQVRQMVTLSPGVSSPTKSSGVMLRVLGAAQKKEVNATQNLAIIVLFFIICWFPLYTINFVKALCRECEVSPVLTYSCIILSHLNSAFNPFLYAYHLKDFRVALHNLIFDSNKIPVRHPKSPFLSIKRKRSEITSSRRSTMPRSSIYLYNDKERGRNQKAKDSEVILKQLQNHLWTLSEITPSFGGSDNSPGEYVGGKDNVLLYLNHANDGVIVSYDNCSVLPEDPTRRMSSPIKISFKGDRSRSKSMFALGGLGDVLKSPKITFKLRKLCKKEGTEKTIETLPWSCDDLRIASYNANGITTKL